MPIDGNNALLGSSSTIALIGYALFSAFITGPEITFRESMKQGWPEYCERIVQLEVHESAPQSDILPSFDLGKILDDVLGSNRSDPYRKILSPIEKMVDQAIEQKERANRFNEERLRQKVQAAGSRCNCAIVMLTEKRISIGLYASSGRLIIPPLFKDLMSELKIALHSPRCL